MINNRGRQRLRSSPGTGWIRIKIMINRNIKIMVKINLMRLIPSITEAGKDYRVHQEQAE